MLHYQYRWIYMVLLFTFIFIFGFHYDIKPLLNQLENSVREKNQLAKQLTTLIILEKNITKSSQAIFIKPSDSLANLLALAHRFGVTILSIHANETGTTNLSFKGNFSQLSSLILNAHHELPHFLIKNFDYTMADQKQLILTIEVEFIKYVQTFFNLPTQKISAHNPFCQPIFFPSHSQQFSIRQIKMVGFLQQGERLAALILLPDQQIVLAYLGTYLGKEQGLVSEINLHQLTITLPDKTQFVLKK